MTPRIVQDAEPGAELATRCQSLGLTLVEVTSDGRIASAHLGDRSLLDKAVIDSELFRRALREQVEKWQDAVAPDVAAIWPGCWVMPVPVTERRRRVGYHVVVTITADIAHAAPFSLWCDTAELDATAASAHLRRHAPLNEADVRRGASIVQWMASDLAQINRQQDEIGHLSQQLGESYEELSLVYQLSARMTVSEDVTTFLEQATRELQQVVGLRWIAMHLTDQDERLAGLCGQTLIAGETGCSSAQLAEVGQELLNRFGAGGTTVIGETGELGLESLLPTAQRIMIVPVVREGKAVAVLFGADKHSAELSSVDSKLVTSAAQSMGIFLENAMLYEDMQDMFMGTLRSLIATIDAKDSYTCGHSERVALLSRQLAAAAGLGAAEVERVYLSALVHDVGKIGVPEAVLCKPGRLTAEEFEMIKAHPEIGVRILQDIQQMRDLLPGVLHHHERWDGRGYPHQLATRDIPLFGRIICLADSFDAMSSDRTYRSAMSLEDVLVEVRRCAGAQFDPELAEIFVTLDFGPYRERIGEHQRRESPLRQAMRHAI